MKAPRPLSRLMLVLALAGAQTAAAEDIDLFLANQQTVASRPNVLLMLDNSSNNNSAITLLDGSKGDKLGMIRQVLMNILDPYNSPVFTNCTVTVTGTGTTRVPEGCVTPKEVDAMVSNINLGLMIQNPPGSDPGGYVRYHVRRMDDSTNRQNLIARLSSSSGSIPESNNAPYAKSMYEAYRYFGARHDYVGFDSTKYDPAARNGEDYVSPITDSCADNYILFIGNGAPDSSEELDSRALLNNIGGVLTTDPVKFSPSNLNSSWFDEFARTFKKQDVAPQVDGVQNVTTFTVAVANPADNNYKTLTQQSARALLQSAATLGGGDYFEANDAQQLLKKMVDLLRKFQAVDSVFAAATLPVSVNVRGIYLNQVYMGQFRPDANASPRWPGNLKVYQIALDVNGNPILADRNGEGVEDTVNGFILPDKTSFWTTPSTFWAYDPIGNPPSASDAPDGNIVEKGGAAQRLRQDFATSQTKRQLFTCYGACAPGASLATTPFDDIPAVQAYMGSDVINWVRGADNTDDDFPNSNQAEIRAHIHGDLLHSRPAVVNYNRYGDDRDIAVYYGTNDGVFHAVKGGLDDADGGEKWGMVFPEFFGKLKRLRDNQPLISLTDPKPYFADGTVSLYQHDVNDDQRYVAGDGDKSYIYVGMRRGGDFAYALDVSDPDDPKYMWKINSGMTGFSELAQTWSTLRPARIRAVADDPVVIFGAGYDAQSEDPLPALANTKGRGIFVVNGRTGQLIKHIWPAGMGSVPADLAVLDRDGDGLFDRIYATDTKGNIWRVDIDDADPANWVSHHLASLGGTGVDARKFLNKPDVVFGADYDAVLVGSGDREHPFDMTVTNRFYMLKDKKVGLTGGLVCGAPGAERTCVESDLVDVTSNPYQNAVPSVPNGWYITLAPGEKVVGNAITVFGTIFFGTNLPTPPGPGVCSNLGKAFIYAVGIEGGTATIDANADNQTTTSDRATEVAGGGFPPSPVYARVEVNGKPVDAVCAGAHCLPPDNEKTTTKRFRTYWHIEQ